MKKLIIFSVFAFFVALGAQAQQTTKKTAQKGIQPLQEEEVPGAVAKAFHKDFPSVKAGGWQILPKSALKEQDYFLQVEDGTYDPEAEPYDFYTVQFYGRGVDAIATYDTNGKLIASQEEIKDAALPMAVSKAIVKDYPGYKVDKDKERIKNLDQTYYKIKLGKSGSHETVYMNPQGKTVSKKSV